MLSGKVIHLIETHEEEITASVIRHIRNDPALFHLAKVSEPELWERGKEILKNLGHWLEHHDGEKLARKYEQIGRTRFEEGVPLHEAIRGLCLIKEKMIDFVETQGLDNDCLTLYAEEQLEHEAGRVFDLMIVHLARGYETAWAHPVHPAA